jgi:hypothetical protein
MLSWIIQITIISIILIFLVHYLINFFKSTLTVPKIKDLVNVPTQKYENMYNIIKRQTTPTQHLLSSQSEDEYTLIDLLPNKEEVTMKNKLKDFLKKQLNSSNDSGNDVATLDSFSDNTFSNY